MALSLESPSLVRQKVYAALGTVGGPGSSSDPAGSAKQKLWWAAAREFFNQWANQGNANLQFVPFDDTQITTAGGYDTGLDAACQVYMFYAKKNANATAAVVKLYDNVTGDSVTTEQTLSMLLDESSQETMQIYPTGFSQATGLIVVAHTTVEGTTDTTAGDAGDGFVIIGAA